jgi:hypothetical protein
MKRNVVLEERVESLAVLNSIHRRCRELGIDEITCAFRDSRDALMAQHIFDTPRVCPVTLDKLVDAILKSSDRVRVTRSGDVVQVRKRPVLHPRCNLAIVVAVAKFRDAASVVRQVEDIVAATGLAPVVVGDDVLDVAQLRRAMPDCNVILPSQLSAVLGASGAAWIHVLTAETRLGPGYASVIEACSAEVSGDVDVIGLELSLLRNNRALDMSFRMANAQTSDVGATLGLFGPSQVVASRVIVPRMKAVQSSGQIMDLVSGQIASGSSLVCSYVEAPWGSVGVDLHHSVTGLNSLAARLRHGADSAARAEAQASMLARSRTVQETLAQIYRYEFVLRSYERSLPCLVIGTDFLDHWQRVLEQLEQLTTLPGAREAARQLEDLVSDADAQLSAIGGTDDGLKIAIEDIFGHPEFAVCHPASVIRNPSANPDELLIDAFQEDVPDSVADLGRRFPMLASLPDSRNDVVWRSVLRAKTAEQIILHLVADLELAGIERWYDVDTALRSEQNGNLLRSTRMFAAAFAFNGDVSALAGLVFGLARLGMSDQARLVGLHAIDLGADTHFVIDVLMDVALPALKRADNLPAWLTDLSPHFNPGQWDRYLHRLLDAGDTEATSSLLTQLNRKHVRISSHVRKRLFHAVGDWQGLIRFAEQSDLEPIDKAREVSEALAHLGRWDDAYAYLAQSSLPEARAKALIASVKLKIGLEDEAFKDFAEISDQEFGSDVLGSKRELIVEAANAKQQETSQQLALDFLNTDVPIELRLFFVARYWDAVGNAALGATHYKHAIANMLAPNWLRNISLFFLHRSLHFKGDHQAAVALLTVYLNEDGPFGSVNDENYLQIRQTFMLLNGIRAKGSLRQRKLEGLSYPTEDGREAAKVLELIQDIRKTSKRGLVLIFDFQTGDAYLIIYFLKILQKRWKLKREEIFVICARRLANVVSMFSDRIGTIIPAEFGNLYVLHAATEQLDDDRVFIAHPEFLSYRADGSTRVDKFRLDFMGQSKLALGLPVNSDGDHPTRVPAVRRKADVRNVFLAPMSNSFRLLPDAFWSRLCTNLVGSGHRVFVNKGPEGQKIFAGTEQIDLPHAKLLEFLDDCDCVIGLRSGLLDVVSSTRAPMIVYYPVPGQAMAWIHMWTLKKLRPADSTVELVINMSDFDLDLLVHQTLRALKNFED